jgi:hypothetical protein
MAPTATLPSAADALTALNGYQQPDSASVLGQAQQKYGVGDLQSRVNTYKTLTQNLTGAIAAVDPSVTGRTAGSLVTEGQRGALVNRERAPITAELGTADQGLSEANNDLGTANNNATNEANMTVADNKDKYNKLLQTYQIANDREQQQATAARQAAQDAEAKREFDVGQATTRGSSSYSGSSATEAAAPGSSQRSDGGFNFQNASGQAISARLYAQLTGTSFNTLLKKMAAAGDKGAQDVLKNGGSAKSYKALTWD